MTLDPIQCRWCTAEFRPHRSDQAFCSAACNKNSEVLEGRRARRIYRAVYHWRLGHATFGDNMRFVCREVSAWIREDREMQRLPPPEHNHDADRGHERKPKPVSLAPKRRTYPLTAI